MAACFRFTPRIDRTAVLSFAVRQGMTPSTEPMARLLLPITVLSANFTGTLKGDERNHVD